MACIASAFPTMTPIKLNVTLRHLRGLEALNEYASFSAASEKLSMTQGALSRLIQELEGQIGFKLFDRTTRKIELTPEGARYLAHAKKVLTEVRKLEIMTGNLGAKERNEIRLGSTANLIASELSDVLGHFHSVQPNTSIHLSDLHPDELVESVKKNQVDLAIGPKRGWSEAEISSLPLFESKLYFVVGAKHRLARMKIVSWADVKNETLILNSQETIRQLEIKREISLVNAKLIKLSHLQSMLALVESGAGITIIYGYAKKLLGPHNVVAIEAVEPHVYTTVCLFKKADAHLERPAQRFFDFVSKARFSSS